MNGWDADIPVGEGEIGRVAAERTPGVSNDSKHDHWIPNRDWALRHGVVAYAGYPLIAGGLVVGVLATFTRQRLTHADRAALAESADAIAAAVFLQQAEDRMRRSRDHICALLQDAATGILVSDALGECLYASESVSELAGYESATGVQKERRDNVLSRMRARTKSGQEAHVTEFLRQIRAGGIAADEPLNFAANCRKISKWMVVSSTQAVNEYGEVDLVIDAFRDVTAHRRAAEAWQLVADASAMLAKTLDAQTSLRAVVQLVVGSFADWCNGALLTMDGRLKGPECAAHVTGLAEPEKLRRTFPTHPEVSAPLARIIRTQKAEFVREVTPEWLDASIYDPARRCALKEAGVQSIIFAPICANGRAFGVLQIGAGNSGRIYDEADVEVAEQLAARVACSIEIARLCDVAEAAVRARDDFFAVASHELRTPLTPLLLRAQGLRRTAACDRELPRERVSDEMALVEKMILRMDRLVGRLLDASEISAGRLSLHPESIELASFVIDVVARFQSHVALDVDTFRVDAEGPLFGDWDRSRLEQVVQALLANAIKYREGKPVHVTVRPQRDAAAIIVKDFGVGIAPEDHERIFNRFERIHPLRESNGFGLGLWVVRRVVEAFGGNIRVESEPGEGATFRVTLPISKTARFALPSVEDERD